MARLSTTVRLVVALAERGEPVPDSLPVTETLSCTGPDAVAVQAQVKSTEPVSAARLALAGETAPQETPPVMERADGVTAFTAAEPALPTCSTRLNASVRRTKGATLKDAERFCTATGRLVTAAAVTAAPELPSVPPAPALSLKLVPSAPVAVKVQV